MIMHNNIFSSLSFDKKNIDFSDTIKPLNNGLAYCISCKKEILWNNAKRHFDEIHLNKKESCPICFIKVKRLTSHLNLHFNKSDIVPFYGKLNKLNLFKITNKLKLDDKNENNDIALCGLKEKNFVDFDKKNKLQTIYNEKEDINYIVNLIKKLYIGDLAKNFSDFLVFKSFNIGQGSHGLVNFGISPKTNEFAAVKIYKKDKTNDFEKEISIVKILQKYKIFPRLLKFDNSTKLGLFYAQSLKGPNLKRLFEFENKNFDNKTILNIACDILYCLSCAHNEGILHGDIKPSNIVWDCFSNEENEPKIILIDYSCSEYSKNSGENSEIKGNYNFGSLSQNKNKKINPWDEIESLIYVLLYFINSDLPWIKYYNEFKINKSKDFINEKRKFIIENHLQNDLKILGVIFNDVKRKNKTQKIDYNFYRKLIINEINNGGEIEKSKMRFCWENSIKNILLNFKKNRKEDLFEELSLQKLLKGFPKEVVSKILMDYFDMH